MQKVWKLYNLSQVESQPFYSLEKGNSVTHVVSWVVLHLKVWHIIWKRKQTKIALLSDYRDRFCLSRWALSNQYDQFSVRVQQNGLEVFPETISAHSKVLINSWPAGDPSLFWVIHSSWAAASRNSRLLSFRWYF